MRNLFFFFSIFISNLQGDEPLFAAFPELHQHFENFHQKQIRIRGFLYRAEDGRLILAEHPNLKSCCVASQKNLKSQLIVTGNVSPPTYGQAVFLEGKLVAKGDAFILENATEITKDRSLMPLIFSLALFITYFIFRVAKKRAR